MVEDFKLDCSLKSVRKADIVGPPTCMRISGFLGVGINILGTAILLPDVLDISR